MVVGTRGRVDVTKIVVVMGSGGGDGVDREVEGGLETGEGTYDIIGSETIVGGGLETDEVETKLD